MEQNKQSKLNCEGDKIHLSFIELENYETIQEFPAPVVAVRKISDYSDFLEKLKEDLSKNNMNKNLVTSVFTQDHVLFDELSKSIPSHTIKLNKGTHKMNLLLEHQSRYILKDFLEQKMIEIGHLPLMEKEIEVFSGSII